MLEGNAATGGGGGVAVVPGTAGSPPLLIEDCVFLGNNATQAGGGLSITQARHAVARSIVLDAPIAHQRL